MGAWGEEPWESDEAADWFSSFFEGIDVDARLDDALTLLDDNEGQVRAACFLLAKLGRVYVWPGDLDNLPKLLDRGVELLSRMIEPDEEGESYIDRWRDEFRPALKVAIERQIEELRERRAALT